MTDLIMTMNDKHMWVNKYKYNELYTKRICIIFLVYEECNEKYYNCKNKESLKKMGPFSIH